MKNNNVKKILKIAEEERFSLKHPYVGSEHLFLALIKNDNYLTNYLKNYNITYDSFKRELLNVVGKCKKDNIENLYTPLLRKIINRYNAKEKNDDHLYEDLFLSMLDEGEGIAIRILLKMNVDLDELYFKLKQKQKINNMEEANKVGILLNSTVNMKEQVIGRDKEINKIILSLTRKKKCNPMLVGPAGIGKTAIVEELVRRINKGLVPEFLKDYKVFMIEMGSLVSGTKYRGEFEERLNNIIKEIINDEKTIIFIDEIHTMLNAGGAEGAINAAEILKPYLARGTLKCIGATTREEYNKSFLLDKALSRRFDVINIKEPNYEEMCNILSGVKKEYEEYHNIKIPNIMIKKIIDLSDFYLKNLVNPDKSIELLDSSCAYAKLVKNHNKLCEEDIINAIYYKTSNLILMNKEFNQELKNKFYNILDENSFKKLSSSFIKDSNKPISLIVNNTVVINKILDMFSNINVINVDLLSINNYSKDSLININDTISNNVFSSIIDNPFSIVIFKNLNNAPERIFNEIKNINEKGYISINSNEKIYFNNVIIIFDAIINRKLQTGFTNNSIGYSYPNEFIKSFTSDIRNIVVKDKSLT